MCIFAIELVKTNSFLTEKYGKKIEKNKKYDEKFSIRKKA
jgi:hypothetical protein